jgi:hypothetical protein
VPVLDAQARTHVQSVRQPGRRVGRAQQPQRALGQLARGPAIREHAARDAMRDHGRGQIREQDTDGESRGGAESATRDVDLARHLAQTGAALCRELERCVHVAERADRIRAARRDQAYALAAVRDLRRSDARRDSGRAADHAHLRAM